MDHANLPGNESDAFSRARGRASRKLGFFIHLTAYVIANGLMIAIDLNSSPNKLWFFWPLGGWGIGLTLHGFAVFLEGSGLKQRMIDRELERERKLADEVHAETATGNSPTSTSV